MEQMTELTKKVLEFLEPDTSKWEYWTTSQPLNSISEYCSLNVDEIQVLIKS